VVGSAVSLSGLFQGHGMTIPHTHGNCGWSARGIVEVGKIQLDRGGAGGGLCELSHFSAASTIRLAAVRIVSAENADAEEQRLNQTAETGGLQPSSC